jgi:hypothetical protein
MKKLLLAVFAISIIGCGPQNTYYQQQPSYQQQAQQPQQQTTVSSTPGLDPQALGVLVKSCSSAQDIEQKLNDPATGINNIDLNNDGQVDYVNVSEYNNNGVRGFDFYVVQPDGSKQGVATSR